MHDLYESVLIINRALGRKQGTKIKGLALNRVWVSNPQLSPNIGRVHPRARAAINEAT